MEPEEGYFADIEANLELEFCRWQAYILLSAAELTTPPPSTLTVADARSAYV